MKDESDATRLRFTRESASKGQVRGAGARHVRPLGRVFAHFRAFAFREQTEKLQVSESLRLLVSKTIAFGSASSVGRTGPAEPL